MKLICGALNPIAQAKGSALDPSTLKNRHVFRSSSLGSLGVNDSRRGPTGVPGRLKSILGPVRCLFLKPT